MRIDLLAVGSQGDVQPIVAMGIGLRKAGHDVRIVTLNGFEDFVRSHGLDHLAIGESPQQIAQTEAGREWIKNRSSTLGHLTGFVRLVGAKFEEGLAKYWENCKDIEALIVSPMGLLLGAHIVEKLRIPLIRANCTVPSVRTVYDWNGRKSLSAALERGWAAFLDRGFHFLGWTALRNSINRARARVLCLPPLPFVPSGVGQSPLLCGYSPAVAPKLPDFPDWIHVTGYWFLEDFSSGWVPPTELVEFLQSGPPPLFIGFGSTPFPNAQAATDLLIRCIARSGNRAIMVAGSSGLRIGRLSPEVFSVPSVPHGWLLPRVRAAIHHCGAGVTGAALRAGLPSITVPVFADQPFWAKRIHRLGAGSRPIPAKSLTEDALINALHEIDEEKLRVRAAELGAKIRKEDGVQRAVEVIEQHFVRRGREIARHQYAH